LGDARGSAEWWALDFANCLARKNSENYGRDRFGGHMAHCGVCGTHRGRIGNRMSALLSMKCHCGPRGSSFAFAGIIKAARAAAANIDFIESS
jgi:hypothetical protein